MSIRSILLMLLSSVALSTTAMAADNTALSPAQEKQVEQIVHDYLLNNPDILIQVSQKLQQKQEQQVQQIQQQAQKVMPQIASQLFADPQSPISGNVKGDVTVIEFFDYQCPHCKDMSPVLDNLVQQDGHIKIIYKEFPIFGADSQFAAAAALASAKQGKYDVFHHALMATPDPLNSEVVLDVAGKTGLDVTRLKTDMMSSDVKQELSDTMKVAQKLQLMGTPAFVVANTGDTNQSVLIPGTTSAEVLQTLVGQARENKLAQSK